MDLCQRRKEGRRLSEHGLPLFFQPPRVYVLNEVWERPECARRAERIADACTGAEVRTFTYDQLPGIVADEGWDHLPRMGELHEVPPPIPVLGVFRFDRDLVARDEQRLRDAYRGTGGFPWHRAAGGGAFRFFCSGLNEIRPNPDHVCRPQWRIQQGQGCPHQCAYCRLGGVLLTHVNTEEYIDRLADLLRQNPWQKTFLYDDVMDVPTLEPQHDTLPPLMRFFESTGDRYLIIHTKTDRVRPIIDAGAPSNTIIAWSLSGPTQSTQLEKIAGTTETRIEAARQCQDAGITVRFKFKPIIPVPDWRQDATYTVDLALARTKPDNLSMTVLMWMQIEEARACIRDELLDPEFVAGAEAIKEQVRGTRLAPFPHELREKVYRHYLAEIRRRDPDVPVTISTESLDMWKSLGPDLGFTPADYVCGCGAGATPGKRRLDTSPWDDARNARTWDGRPATPGCD